MTVLDELRLIHERNIAPRDRKKEVLHIVMDHAITALFEIAKREIERIVRERKYGKTYYDWK